MSLTEFPGPAIFLRTLEPDLSRLLISCGDNPAAVLPTAEYFSMINLSWDDQDHYAGKHPPQITDFCLTICALCLPYIRNISLSMLMPYRADFDPHELVGFRASRVCRLTGLSSRLKGTPGAS